VPPGLAFRNGFGELSHRFRSSLWYAGAQGDAERDRHRLTDYPGSRGKSVANQLVWFDVPVLDLDRAIRFYSAVLASDIAKQEHPEMTIGLLPGERGDVSGCLFLASNADEKPSGNGLLIYLNVQGRLDEAEGAVETNGGKVLQSKHQIGPYGFRAVILDSEGNRIALHST
jgi:uncharacterized protein